MRENLSSVFSTRSDINQAVQSFVQLLYNCSASLFSRRQISCFLMVRLILWFHIPDTLRFNGLRATNQNV